MEESYAQALWHMIEKGMTPKEAVQRMHSLLVSRGREGLMPRIARALKRLAEQKRAARSITLSVAREGDLRHAHREAKDVLSKMGAQSSDVTEAVDSSLTGGWRMEGRETLVDASFKSQLISLYNLITKHG
ncbi:MAG: F0F1 ATP synthase subunit delta [Patescibacteria group bacterium]|nr:F0F1 ATP synthase subunit delta [bacterium]MDZ4227492.1 F0F1 ATP synthase subunit delta [Patescibacteria group bacterium]